MPKVEGRGSSGGDEFSFGSLEKKNSGGRETQKFVSIGGGGVMVGVLETTFECPFIARGRAVGAVAGCGGCDAWAATWTVGHERRRGGEKQGEVGVRGGRSR